MTDQQKRFFELAKKYESTKAELKAVKTQLDNVMMEIGKGNYLQDPETGLVYSIYEPLGTFVEYQTIAYKRTAKEGERGGTVLSKKEAEEQGFTILKK